MIVWLIFYKLDMYAKLSIEKWKIFKKNLFENKGTSKKINWEGQNIWKPAFVKYM